MLWLFCEPDKLCLSWVLRQMVIVWLISTFRDEEEHENHFCTLLEIWRSFGYFGSLIIVETTVVLTEDIAINSVKIWNYHQVTKADNRLEKLESFELCRRILEDVYKLCYHWWILCAEGNSLILLRKEFGKAEIEICFHTFRWYQFWDASRRDSILNVYIMGRWLFMHQDN